MSIWIKKHQQLVIIVSFALLSFLSLYIVYVQNGHILIGDDYHFHQNRIEGLALSIKNGIFFPKISYFFIGGYGYASSLFYPDFYLYLPAFLRLAGLSLASSYIIFAVVINFGTFLLTYFSGRWMQLSKSKSYLFSLLYTLSIYRLQDLLNRQAIGELLAMSFFPVVLASIYLLRKGQYSKWPLLTFAMTAIGLAHFISLEIISLFIAGYILLNAKQFFQKQPLFALVKATVLTLLLLAFYLIPVMEQMLHTTFQVTANPLVLISERSYSLWELFANSFKNSVFHASSANIGIILLLGLLVYTSCSFKKITQTKDLLILALLFLFMTTNIFPWQLFNHTPLNTIQFPWRLLSLVTLLASFLIANDELGLFKKIPSSPVILCICVLIGVVIYEAETLSTESKRVLSYEKYDQTNPFYIGAGHEYLPKEVDYEWIKKNKTRRVASDARNMVTVTNEAFPYGMVTFDYSVSAGKSSTVTVPFIYYYGYQAMIESGGTTKQIQPKMNQKTSLVELPVSGEGKAVIYYQQTWAQKISLIGSLVTFVSCLLYAPLRKIIRQRRLKHR